MTVTMSSLSLIVVFLLKKELDDVVCSKVSWLEAAGTGAAKREVRHAASAKLPVLLFILLNVRRG